MSANQWWQFLGWLAAETCAVVGVAALLQCFFRSPRAGRTLWRAAIITIGLVWLVELSGARAWIPPLDSKNHHFVVTTRIAPSLQLTDPEKLTASDPTGEPVALEVAPPPIKWPAWIWLSGVVLFLTRFAGGQIWLAVRRSRAVAAETESRTLAVQRQNDFGLRQVECQVWPRLPGPVAFGILRPTIALPLDFHACYSAAEREAILAHELAHLAARDPLWRAMGDVVLALAWWHPLVWWARRQLQAVSEAAADEASVLVPGGALALAECLVRLGRDLTAPGSARALGVAGNGPRSQLAARVQRLLHCPRAWQPLSIWGRWVPRISAVAAAIATVFAPIQTGLSGSILSVLAMAAFARAEHVPAPPVSSDAISLSNTESNTVASATTNEIVSTNAAIESAQSIQTINRLSTATTDLAVRTTNATLPRIVSRRVSLPGSHGTGTNEASPTISILQKETSPGVYEYTYTVDSPSNSTAPATLASNTTASLPFQKATPPTLSVNVEFMEISEEEANDLGLDWFFGTKASIAPTMETYTNWVFGLEPMTNIGGSNQMQMPPDFVKAGTNHPRHLRIDRYRAAGQSVAMNVAQHRAFRDRVVKKPGTDILSAPKVILRSGQHAEIKLEDVLPIVTGVETSPGFAKKSASCLYLTDNVGVGVTVTLAATMKDPVHWRVQTQAAVSKFLGNDKVGKEPDYIPNGDGKALGFYAPHPHFRAVEADSDDSVLLGDTLVLRSPPWMETNKIKGHFLSHGKMTTAEHRLYVFVTPNIATEKDMKN